jgi:CDP-4-dehydro-6-deoxyglucose reductase
VAKEWQRSRLVRVEASTPATRRYWFEMPDLDRFEFTPGQFVTFDLPIGEKPKDRWRSYSIASAPNGSSEFELVIVLVPEGPGTNFLFHQTKIGDELQLTGPVGKFVLPASIDTDLCFVCTGTGIAPFRSMLLDLINHPRPTRDIHLIFGTRTIQDVLYYDEMQALAQRLPQLKYHVTLSREVPENWTGHRGYVHAIYEELFRDKRPAHFFICGWKNMIDEARQRLGDMGYDRKQIHFELYG